MPQDRRYGKISGLRERLDEWMHSLSHDHALPWVGLGLIDDLEAMARYMDGERTDPVVVEDEDEFAGWVPPAPQTTEYDL